MATDKGRESLFKNKGKDQDVIRPTPVRFLSVILTSACVSISLMDNGGRRYA